MTWKTITTFVTNMSLDSAALEAAIELARRQDAHLEILALGIDMTQPETWYGGSVGVVLRDTIDEADRESKAIEAAIRKKLEGEDLRWSVTALATPAVGLSITGADAARFTDLVVAAQPYGPGRGTPQVQLVEAVLFGAGIPVLIVPDRMQEKVQPMAFDHVMLAWNDSPEALRAVREALPVLGAASEVEIIVIDPPRHGPDRSDPGGRVAQLLARHGIRSDIRILARTMPQTSDVLVRHIEERGADLLVMGAYGHSRLRESILGGTTRNMLEKANVPVLMVK